LDDCFRAEKEARRKANAQRAREFEDRLEEVKFEDYLAEKEKADTAKKRAERMKER
jgi:hypothetical protein